MKLQTIIYMLKKTGVNSKQQVIDKLSTLSKEDLLELRQDIKVRLCQLVKEEGR